MNIKSKNIHTRVQISLGKRGFINNKCMGIQKCLSTYSLISPQWENNVNVNTGIYTDMSSLSYGACRQTG